MSRKFNASGGGSIAVSTGPGWRDRPLVILTMFEEGQYLGTDAKLTPDEARRLAAWLNRMADRIEEDQEDE